jgi:uncharacterized cupin superfamily protein
MKVIRTAELPWTEGLTRGAYAQRTKELDAGPSPLSCSLFELAPGKKSFPLHRHHVTEEALYALSGRATVRTTEGLTSIGPGDFVAFPAGGLAHQLLNDGTEPFVYLGLSSVSGVDVVEYPDSRKVSSSLGRWPDLKRFMFRAADQVQYFDDDPDA